MEVAGWLAVNQKMNHHAKRLLVQRELGELRRFLGLLHCRVAGPRERRGEHRC